MPVITIARGSMWGGQAVAEKCAALLGCPCIGREDLIHGLPKEATLLDDPTAEGHSAEEVWDRLSSQRSTYVAAVQATLAEYACGGSMVYHGHAGHLLLKGIPGVLRVRVIAPMTVRAKVVMEKKGLTVEEAEAYIRRVDSGWERWTRFTYGVDWRDPALYDMVLNLEVFSVESACACVLEAAKRPEFEVTDDMRATLKDLAIKARVQLALALTPLSRDLEWAVESNQGKVQLELRAKEKGLPEAALWQLWRVISEIVRAVEGVTKVSLRQDQVFCEPD